MGAGVLDGIGSTPVVRLEHLVEHGMAECPGQTVALGLARELGAGVHVVTPLVDSSLEYLAGELCT